MTPHTTGRPPARRLRVAAATLIAATTLSACELASPITTDMEYDPAEGVSVETADMELLNLVVVSEANGSPGVIAGYAVNTSSEPLTVDLALEADGERMPLDGSVEVAPGKAQRLVGESDDGELGDPMTASAVPGVPGGMVTVRLTTSAGGAASARVPVLPPDGVFAPYADLLADSGDEG